MSLDINTVETFYTYEDYDWSVIGVIKADDGYYVGTDSGCSCYWPWENYDGDTWGFTGPMSFEDMCAEVRSIAKMYPGVDRTELDEYLGSLE